MINIKKGTAFSLSQSDIRGLNPGAPYGTSGATVITAGSLNYVNSSGVVTAAGGTTYSNGGIRGFAINNSYDGDALESGKIALYTLDGNSVIETDQVDVVGDIGGGSTNSAINTTNYPVGTPLYASQATAGLVSKTTSGTPGPIIGWVEGVRALQNATPYPSGVSFTQNATSATEFAAQQYAATNGLTNAFQANSTTGNSRTFKAQVNVNVLSIKLASGV